MKARFLRIVSGCFAILFWSQSVAMGEAPLPDLGPDWFTRLRAPGTRAGALREWDTANRRLTGDGIEEGKDTPEYFAAYHRDIRVLPAPQPGNPEAWLVWWTYDYESAEEIHLGPDPEDFPPATAETSRVSDTNKGEETGLVWKPGGPWLESVGAFLTNDKGKILSEFNFLGCGVIVDADGDGMLDWIQFSTVHFREKAPAGKEADTHKLQGDLISIGPIDPSADRSASWLVNLRTDPTALDRAQRFDLRARREGKGVEIVVVVEHHADERRPKEVFLLPGQNPPENSGVIALGSGDRHETANAFASQQFSGKKISIGWGSDDAVELRAGEPKPATLDSPGKPFSVPPGIVNLSPAAAALALVDHNRDDSHREKFDLVLDPPLPELPSTGWVEVLVEPGWADSSLSVWWLREDGSECWTCEPKDEASHFAVSAVPREPLARWISTLAHLDRVRTVPRQDGLPRLEHDRFGGDDHTVITIRAGLGKPSPGLVDFEPAVPTLWNAIRGPYDRPLAAVLAVTLGTSPPGWETSGNFARRDPLDAAEQWLDPQTIATVPPPLAQRAILAIGLRGRDDLKPRLTALLEHWGPASAEEQSLSRARMEERTAYRLYWEPPYDFSDAAQRRLNLAILTRRKLEPNLVNDPEVSLRETIAVALRMLESRNDPLQLEAWAKEPDAPGADLARRRLETMKRE